MAAQSSHVPTVSPRQVSPRSRRDESLLRRSPGLDAAVQPLTQRIGRSREREDRPHPGGFADADVARTQFAQKHGGETVGNFLVLVGVPRLLGEGEMAQSLRRDVETAQEAAEVVET